MAGFKGKLTQEKPHVGMDAGMNIAKARISPLGCFDLVLDVFCLFAVQGGLEEAGLKLEGFGHLVPQHQAHGCCALIFEA